MKTDITVILDRSGSMASIAADTIGGFNRLLSDQKAQPGEAVLSLVQFDDRYEAVHLGVPLAQVEPLTDKTFVPRGSTALLDAIGRTIDATGARLAALTEAQRPGKVLCVIVTDGQENASKTFTRAQVFQRISHQRDAYQWEFLFLGANQDSITEAGALGIPASHAMNYSPDTKHVNATYASASAAMSRARGGATLAVTDDERRKSVQH